MDIGERYYALRSRLALIRSLGLTDLYQAMHSEAEKAEEKEELEEEAEVIPRSASFTHQATKTPET